MGRQPRSHQKEATQGKRPLPTQGEKKGGLPGEILLDQHLHSGQGGRLDQTLRALTGLSHNSVRGLIESGAVSLNGREATDPALLLSGGEHITARYEPGRRYRPKAKPRPNRGFRLVHEDPHLVVVEKQAGVLSEPNKGEKDTLVQYVESYLGRGRRKSGRVWVVHRLDRDTSGLLVLARHPKIAAALKDQFAKRKPQREYVAFVAGRVKAEQGTFSSLLATDAHLNQYSTRDTAVGKAAVTHYRVTGRLTGATEVRVTLETGRRNQIRVHFAEAGHPVLGDIRYEAQLAFHPRWKERRLALHATLLGFTHPETGKALLFECPPPEAFERFRDQAGPDR